MKKTLEKFVNSVKKIGRKAIATIAIPVILATPVNAGKLDVKVEIIDFSTSKSYISNRLQMAHKEGAIEGYSGDNEDVPYLDNPDSIKFVSVISGYELRTDWRPANSTTPFNTKLETKNNQVEGYGYLIFDVIDSNDFEWKNLIIERYGLDDVNDSNNIKEVWDVKYVYGQGYIPFNNYFQGQKGLRDQFVLRPFNHADFNRDRKVNLKDYAIFANEWSKNDPNRFGSYVGADPNDLGAYVDIDRSGTVDFNDFDDYFCYEYLWSAE